MILEPPAVFRSRSDMAIASDLLRQQFSTTIGHINYVRGVFGFTLVIHKNTNTVTDAEILAYCQGIRDALEAQGR